MNVELLKVGYCFHPEAMVLPGNSFRAMQFPAVVGLIHHPKLGAILFDTGYANRFSEATRRLPEKAYAWVTPFTLPLTEHLLPQLQRRGIDARDVHTIFVSHFHADHIAGLKDFPQANIVCAKSGLEAIVQRGRWSGLIKGYLKNLLPDEFATRAKFIEEQPCIALPNEYKPFDLAYDILGDASLLAVNLPGHAHGHFGLLIAGLHQPLFLVGDACWCRESFQQRRAPNPLANIIMADGRAYRETLHKLADLYSFNSDVRIVPSHCIKTFNELSTCLVR